MSGHKSTPVRHPWQHESGHRAPSLFRPHSGILVGRSKCLNIPYSTNISRPDTNSSGLSPPSITSPTSDCGKLSHIRIYRRLMMQAWFLAIYNFFTFAIAAMVPLKDSFVFLPFDLSFCALLLTALVLQQPYMPKLPRVCEQTSGTLANGYFKVLAETRLQTWKPGKDDNGQPLSPPSANSTCKDFYIVWALEITML